MKYLKTFKIFERKDIEQSEKLDKVAQYLLKFIKRHFIDSIKKYLKTKDIKYINNIGVLKYKEIVINIEEDNYISFSIDKDDNKILNIGVELLLNIISDIKNNVVSGNIELYLDELKDTNLYNELSDKDRLNLIHELTHKFEYEELYDVFDVLRQKILNIPKEDIFNNKKNIDKFWTNYLNNYYQIPAEYNAFFISATNSILHMLKKDKSILDKFDVFKETFLFYFNMASPNMYKDKFRKHINKRIYQLYNDIKKNEKI